METLDGGQRAVDRRVGRPRLAAMRDKILDVAAGHAVRARHPALRQECAVGLKVTPIRRDRVGREVALHRQVPQVLPAAPLQLGHT